MQAPVPTPSNLRQELKLILGMTESEEVYKQKLLEMIGRNEKTISPETMHTIEADVERSLQSIYTGMDALNSHRKTLLDIIVIVFKAEKNLQYTQGFHDVASALYLVYCDETNEDERRVYSCSEAFRRVLRIYLLSYALQDPKRIMVEVSKLYKIGGELVKSDMDIIKETESGIVSFIPILTTLGTHFLKQKESILRTLEYCLSCGRYSPFYFCCSLIVNSDIPENPTPESVMLDGSDGVDRIMLPGLKYGYRPKEVSELNYVITVIEEARAMLARRPPVSYFKNVYSIEDQIPENIDEPWNPSMDEETEEARQVIDECHQERQPARKMSKSKVSGITAGVVVGFIGLAAVLTTSIILSKRRRRR